MISKKRGMFYVVLALSLILLAPVAFSPVSAAVNGCYTYSKASEDLYCVAGGILQDEAQKDCAKQTGCDINQHFIPGSDCSELDDCKEITCKVDCKTHALGKCQQLAGSGAQELEVFPEEYDYWCSPGCCKFTPAKATKDFCQFNLNKYQCDKQAALGGAANSIFDNSAGMNLDQCNKNYCKIQIITSDLTIFAQDSAGNLLAGVKITLQGEAQEKTTDSSGSVKFSGLTPKTYLVKAAKEGYLSASATIPLASNTSKVYNFTLIKAEGTASVSGIIADTATGAALSGATLWWKGAAEGKTTSDSSGKFSAPNLLPGEYTFTASIIGYKPSTQPLTLEANKPATLDFKLEKSALQGITGTTYLDSNDNGELDAGDTAVAGAKLYVDGIFKGFSSYPEGKFELSVEVKAAEGKETHKLSATSQDYSGELELELTQGETFSQDLLLTRYLGECSQGGASEGKDVEAFYAVPVPGKKEVQLSWKKPCPEVIGYNLKKCQEDQCLDLGGFPPTLNTYTDTLVEWEATYTYRISAIYDYGLSKNLVEQPITLGSELCENRYHELTGWETFCFGTTPEERKKVWTCDDANKLIESKNCGEMDGTGENYYCARVAEGVAECKNTGSCGLFGNPFGLYYNREMCYGGEIASGGNPANYCYYEYTNTVVEQCKSCTQVNSCFDFQSKEACEVKNSCLSKDCVWINAAKNDEPIIDYSLILPGLVTPETGAGYCADKDYKKDDKCWLCSPSASLFDNYFCTAQVCSALGNCFASAGLKYCQSCGKAPTKDTNCYSYLSKLECVGTTEGEEAGIYKDPAEHITFSDDKCSWKRCAWEGASGVTGTCFKDGDVDRLDDCSGFGDIGSANTCRMDNSPPQTAIEPAGVNVISLAHPNITFFGNDKFHKYANQQSDLGVLGFCLTSGDPTAPNTCVTDNEGNSAFVEVPYAGKLPEEYLTVDLINSKYVSGQSITGNTYKLKFYSQDKYFNQEDLQEAFVFIDNVVPEFEIKDTQETTADVTALTITLEGIGEPLECTFELLPVIPSGSLQTQTVARETELKEVKFESLTGVKYDLNVTCKDDHDNTNTKNATYVFDLEQNIDVIEPALKGIIAATDIVFKVHTDVGAICALYLADTNEKITDFIPNEEGKEHYTNTVTGFTEGKYVGTHKIVCTDLLTGETMEDYFDFTVDFTPPGTQIILKEGKREVKPTDYGWEEYFISSVNIDFECTAEGFECSKTFYCLGIGCELIGSPEYKEYTGTVPLNETSQICYYSTDAGDSMVFSPLCGKVIVDGYGITLEQPQPYLYGGEVWGISNVPVFNWGFFTKVPTKECGFDFTSGFDYMALPAHKKKLLNSEQKYLFENFPESVLTSYAEDGGTKAVYVKCLNNEDEIGPEKKMNLEYDPTAPEITEAYAKPDLVLEEIFTTLFTVTDDKTLCKFSDNSGGIGSNEYYTMEFPFPGLESNTLEISHQAEFGISDVNDDGKKDYSLLVQCKNGAENLSNVKDINFSVDYTAVGYIIASSLAPSGYVNVPEAVLKAETSKTGFCGFRENATQPFTPMDGAGGKIHGYALSKLSEGAHKFLVQCAMGDHIAEASIEFTVDLTPPAIKEINDGNRTCGNDKLSVYVYTDDVNVTGYYYELYDAGEDKSYVLSAPAVNASKSSINTFKTPPPKFPAPKSPAPKVNASLAPKTGLTQIANGTLPSSFPLEIPAPNGTNTSGFTIGHKYVVKVKAQDAAGNWGNIKESDGITATYKNYSACIADIIPPKVTILINDNCTLSSPLAELHCEDENGCTNFKYGKSFTSACNATLSYSGFPIPIDKKSWLCYFVADTKGQNTSKTELVLITDDDGDGIINKCDQCLLTPAGKVVDKGGCASGDVLTGQNQTFKDSDNDGLPDDWEKKYNAEGCEFDYTKKDSDGDTLADSMEDYDEDGLTNYKEYTSGTNPCIKDLLGPKIEPGKLEPEANKTKLPEKEDVTPPAEEWNLIAWILLIIGLLLTFGGGGYLIYYYNYAPVPAKAVSGLAPSTSRITPSAGEGVVNALRSKLALLKKGKEERLKQRAREGVFGAFTTKSAEIPHVGSALSGKASPLEKVQQAAQKYVEHKEEIKSGLKAGEKGIFSKLESLAKPGKAQEISTTEAKDIFSQLKDLSKKRKEGGK